MFEGVLGLRGMRKNLRAVLPLTGVLALLCATLTILANASLAQQGSFVVTGSLNTARIQHAATLLSNARCLLRVASMRTTLHIRVLSCLTPRRVRLRPRAA